MPGVACMVDAEIRCDPIEPSAEAGLSAVRLARAIDTEKDFLGEFFSDGLVVDHTVHEMNDGLAVFLDEEVKARHIAGSQFQHDGGVIHLAEFACSRAVFGSLQVFKKSGFKKP